MADSKKIKNVNDIKVGDFVKFIDRDKQGKFSYVGEVISVTGNSITMRSFEGVFGFTICEENDLELCSKPTGWKKFLQNADEFKKEVEKKAQIKPKKTKQQIIQDYIKNNPKLKESGILKLAHKELGGDKKLLKIQIKLAMSKKTK